MKRLLLILGILLFLAGQGWAAHYYVDSSSNVTGGAGCVTGTFTANEMVFQATSNAVAKLVGAPTASPMILTNIQGVPDDNHVWTGFSSSATFTPNATPVANGSDAADGSLATPFASITKVNALVLAADDIVSFRKDCWWNGLNLLNYHDGTSAAHPITFNSYGTGGNPLITNNIPITGAWTADGGGIYHINVGAGLTINVCYDALTYLVKNAGNFATLSAGQWDYSSPNLYVNVGGDPGPGTKHLIQYAPTASNFYAVRVNGNNYQVFDGLDAGIASYYGYFIDGWAAHVSTGNVVKNCKVYKSGSQDVYAHGDSVAHSYVAGLTFQNITGTDNDGTSGTGLQIGMVFTSGPALITNCNTVNGKLYLIDGVTSTATIQNSVASQAQVQGYGSVTVANNVLTGYTSGGAVNIEKGSSATAITSLTINGNNISNDTYAGIWIACDDVGITFSGLSIYNNWISNCGKQTINGVNGGIILEYNIGTSIVYNNIIANCGVAQASSTNVSGIGVISWSTHGTPTGISIYNNTIYNIIGNGIKVDDWDAAVCGVTLLENNIIYQLGSNPCLVIKTDGDVTTCDYNLYYLAAGNMLTSGANSYTMAQFGTWKSAKSLDAHSPTPALPAFVNAGGSYTLVTDFLLGSSSPAINVGATIAGLTADYAGTARPVSAGYEIGAYEYLASPTITTQAVTSYNVGAGTATGNGTITDQKGATWTASGVCWGTSPNPTVAGSKADGSGHVTGAPFTANIAGLGAARYHARAFLTSSEFGTVYGSDVSFGYSGGGMGTGLGLTGANHRPQ